MVTEEMKRKFARLAVRTGVNVQKGQPMLIGANLRDAEFVRLCVEEAYEAGAKWVSVDWRDDITDNISLMKEDIETLCDIPDWAVERTKYRQEKKTCYLSVKTDLPGVNKDVDPEKIRAMTAASKKKFGDLDRYYMTNQAQWCVVTPPSREWARIVFPSLPEEEAFEKLSDAIFTASRVREQEDPIREWEEHNATLHRRADAMNDYNFRALHFTSKTTGTDITVGLVEDHIWVGGSGPAADGTWFNPNIPTEEVFTMPSRTRVNGFVRSSLPLDYNGILIEGLWLRFKDGKVVEHGADKGKDGLDQLLALDEGSKSIGEIALVPYDSPISKMGILFYKTLFDENAACHMALGRPYPENIKGGGSMDVKTLMAHDANDSAQHVDFMFGTKDMQIDGIGPDDTRTAVFRDGNFVF